MSEATILANEFRASYAQTFDCALWKVYADALEESGSETAYADACVAHNVGVIVETARPERVLSYVFETGGQPALVFVCVIEEINAFFLFGIRPDGRPFLRQVGAGDPLVVSGQPGEVYDVHEYSVTFRQGCGDWSGLMTSASWRQVASSNWQAADQYSGILAEQRLPSARRKSRRSTVSKNFQKNS